MARSKRTPMKTTRTKIHILTGGIKEDVAQVEMRGGELIDGVNYQEVDGLYHGYISIPGYERVDGTGLASAVGIDVLADYGLDKYTSLLIECDNATPTDKGYSYHTVTNNGVIYDTSVPCKFYSGSFFFNNTYLSITPSDTSLDMGSGDYVIDFVLKPSTVTGTRLLLEKSLSYKLELVSGNLKFSASSDGVSYTDTLTSAAPLSALSVHHVEVSRRDGEFLMFINGVKEAATLPMAAVFDNASPLVIGGNSQG